MGECLISRRGGGSYELPVLNDSYPKDASIMASQSGSVSFSVSIAEDGKPAFYTYQWYLNGISINGANAANYVITDVTSAGTNTVYCVVTNKAGSVTSRIATFIIEDPMPTGYTYTGTNATTELVKQDAYNWYIQCTTSGTLAFARDMKVDVYLLGGGGGGGSGSDEGAGGGGGGGDHATYKSIEVTAGTPYEIVIGAGGANSGGYQSFGGDGGVSSAFGYSVNGGEGGHCSYQNYNNGQGGAGGTGRGGGATYLPESNTVRAFMETSDIWPLYGGGGSGDYGTGSGGAPYGGNRNNAAKGYGGGGGGGSSGGSSGKNGYQGIVLVRNAR